MLACLMWLRKHPADLDPTDLPGAVLYAFMVCSCQPDTVGTISLLAEGTKPCELGTLTAWKLAFLTDPK